MRRPPVVFVYGNCAFGAGHDDGWAIFAVSSESYEWLSEGGKRSRFLALLGALEAAGADLQIMRVSRAWDTPGYARDMGAGGSQRHPGRARPGADAHEGVGAADSRARARRQYTAEHTRRLNELGAEESLVFFAVSLSEPERDVASYVSQVAEHPPREWVRALRRGLSMPDRRLLRASELEQARVRADQAHARLSDFLPVRPARAVEMQWLTRRAFCRGLIEPRIDSLHEPRALVFERNGEAMLAPLEGDVLRWMDSYVEHRGRLLRIESESGVSWQTHLVMGALPERATFPGPRVELMFAPAESLPFSVDLTLNARFLSNDLALRITRRQIQDADQIVRAESDGEQGISDQGYQRTQEARDLLAYLQSASRPPLLRTTLTVAIGAGEEAELERRVAACRRAYGEICLHRPVGEQLALFCQHLPGQRTRIAGYDDTLTCEQVAAMMPTATHVAGSASGFYLGHTLSGSRRPVRFNLREGSESDRNTAILSVGALGSGKTTLDQKLKYEGFLLGARIIDCDPKGDHRFHLLEEVAPHVECITLRPDPALRGVLDPMRVAPEHLRQDAAVSFLRDLLPGRAEPSWETAVVGAVDCVLRRGRPATCLEVVHALREGDDTDRQVAKTLDVYARSGLTQLGFADHSVTLPPVGQHQVTYLPIRDLPSPEPGVPRSEYSQTERVGGQMVRLIVMFAMQLMKAERGRLKLFSLDRVLLRTRHDACRGQDIDSCGPLKGAMRARPASCDFSMVWRVLVGVLTWCAGYAHNRSIR